MILVRHGEIYTKSEPVRKQFIRRLVNNIKVALPDAKVKSKRWRIMIYAKDEKQAVKKLKRVFGIVSFSQAIEIEADMKTIKAEALKIAKSKKAKTFAIRAKRLSKQFEKTSQQINEQLGSLILKNTNMKVNLSKPDLAIYIEIYAGKAYVFPAILKGPGGLPLGVSGCAELLPGKNKEKAALLMMKRGCIISNLPKAMDKWNYTLKESRKPLFKITPETDLKKFIKLYKKHKFIFAPLIGLDKEYKAQLFSVFDKNA